MPEVITRLQQQAVDFWKNLDKSQRIRIYVISAVLLVAIATGIILITRPNYVPLIRNANSSEIGEMAKILDDEKIKYSLKDNGSSIYIDGKDNNRAQVLLFQNGYPKSGMSFEDAFKMIQINTTESDKKKLWENYKKTTLIEKLKMFDNVKDADVDLALPDQSMFVQREDQKPTAYVRVTPEGEQFTPEQVKGIVLVVSRSVENLNPKDVTVVDNNLNVLNSETDDVLAATSTQEKLRLQKKKELEQNVYNIFTGQFDNFDSIRVVANPILDFNKLKSVTQGVAMPEGYEDGGALVSTRRITENLENGQTAGEPGVGTNPGTVETGTPSYPMGAGENSNYKKSDVTENYEYTRSTTESEKALGDLMTDRSTMTVTLSYGKRVTDETKLSQEFLNQFKEDVSKATGIPIANIAVNKYKLAPIEVEVVSLPDTIRQYVNDYGFFALLLLLIIGLMISMFPRRKAVAEEDAVLLENVAPAAGPRFIVPEEEDVPEIDLEERSEVKRQLDKFVKQKPDAVAQLLRNWISEEWD